MSTLYFLFIRNPNNISNIITLLYFMFCLKAFFFLIISQQGEKLRNRLVRIKTPIKDKIILLKSFKYIFPYKTKQKIFYTYIIQPDVCHF
jgi:hypothetical protein